jgi:hypothetical protein
MYSVVSLWQKIILGAFDEIFNWHKSLVSKNKSFSMIQYVGRWHPRFATERADRCIFWNLVSFSTIWWTESNILENLNIVLFSVKLRAIVLYMFNMFFPSLLSFRSHSSELCHSTGPLWQWGKSSFEIMVNS